MQAMTLLGCLQSVESDTGRIVDDFSLVKPMGWKPNYKGMLHALALLSVLSKKIWMRRADKKTSSCMSAMPCILACC